MIQGRIITNLLSVLRHHVELILFYYHEEQSHKTFKYNPWISLKK